MPIVHSVNVIGDGGLRVVTYPVGLSFCDRHGVTKRELYCGKCRRPVLLRTRLVTFIYNIELHGIALRRMLQQQNPVTYGDLPAGVRAFVPA